MEKSVSAGSQTFEQALYKLFKSGQITKEEAMRGADSVSNLSTLIDFSERTSTTKVPIFNPNDPELESNKKAVQADFSGIKLDLDDSK